MGISSRTLMGLLALCAATACAPARPARVGDASSLVAPDATAASLAALTRERELTVLVFWSGGCPCVRRYQGRVDALLDRYREARVRVIGVASNAGESLSEAQRVAAARGVRIPIYRDEGGAVARALDVTTTPTVVVLDARGEVRFRGWLDDEREPGDPRRHPWLEQALDDLLAGRDARTQRTPTWGCTITRSLFADDVGGCHAPTHASSAP